MRKPASIRSILLATLLAVSHVFVVTHVTTHLKSTVNNCECCVCQGQTFAAPLPSAESVVVSRAPGLSLQSVRITLVSKPVLRRYLSRAPPVIL